MVENTDYSKEVLSGQAFCIVPMGVGLFYAGEELGSALPPDISSNPFLLEQSAKRRELFGALEDIYEKVEDVHMDLEDAVRLSLITEGEVIRLYKNLTEFIRDEDNNQRIILYLPPSFLPDMSSVSQNDDYESAKQDFAYEYRKGWERLLFEREVRASFVDGDVLEDGLGEPDRVRKAAHLIPDMLEKEIITIEEISEFFRITDGEIIRSLSEGVLAAFGRRLITTQDLAIIGQSTVFNELLSNAGNHEEPKEEINLQNVFRKLNDEFSKIDEELVDMPVSQSRKYWLRGIKRGEVLNAAGENISALLNNDSVSMDELNAVGDERGWSGSESLSVIKSILYSGEKGLKMDLEKAKMILSDAWGGSDEIKNELIGGIVRWKRLGLLDSDFMARLGIKEHDLSLPMPVDADEILESDLGIFTEVAEKILRDSELSEFFYPAIVLFGSRIKGYSGLNADRDGAIFIKPGVPFERRDEILEKLYTVATELKNIGKVIEFWVNEDGEKVKINTEHKDSHILTADEIHILAGGFWMGKGSEARKLYEGVLRNYVDLSDSEHKDQTRDHLLGQIEFDFLQYRIMHKGYHRFYSDKRKKAMPYSNLIDWDSAFWDPGFRRIATKLFVSRVFLPDLSISDALPRG